MPKDRISNKVFRDTFEYLQETEDLTLAEIAARIGWQTKDRRTGDTKPDSSRVGRTLGMVAESGKKRESVTYDNAVLLCDALHLDYHDVGI